MKKSEQIILAVCTIAFGILLMVLKANFIGILMTVAGVLLIVFGCVDIARRLIPFAVIKIVTGVLIILCGWVLVKAVLYIIAGLLLIAGILLLYDTIKSKRCVGKGINAILEYVKPILLIVIGGLLLFHQGKTINVIFILSGIFTIIEGGVVLAASFFEE
jgi:uncharacterized membrane protein HdeD (DUF308 family)